MDVLVLRLPTGGSRALKPGEDALDGSNADPSGRGVSAVDVVIAGGGVIAGYEGNRNLARTRQNLSSAYRSLGQLDLASRLLIEARDGLRQVVREVPGHVIYRGDLASACADLAHLMNQRGKPTDAIDAAVESITIFNELARVDPENMAFRRLLASAHEAAAEGHESLGQIDAALRDRRNRLVILERQEAGRSCFAFLSIAAFISRRALSRRRGPRRT